MESISRNVGDLTASERQVYETALGHQISAGQQIIVQLIDIDTDDANGSDQSSAATQPSAASQKNGDTPSQLPEWCGVYRGLSDAEVESVEQSILARSPASRNIDVDF